MCQWGRFYLTHFRFTMATEQCFLPPHAIAPDQFIVPLQCFQLTHFPTIYERPWAISMPDRSRSGHFAVKNIAVLTEVGFEGARFDRGRFLDDNDLSSREKRSRKSFFSPHPTRASRRFSSARSNARSQVDITQSLSQKPAADSECVKWNRPPCHIVNMSNGTVPIDTLIKRPKHESA